MTHEWLGLAGKVAAVTGAGSGIGRAVALNFAQAGATPVLLDRNVEAMAQVAAEVKELGVTALVIAVDVSDPDSVTEAAKAAGTVDILVNNAGMSRPGAMDQVSFEDWTALLAVNMNGYFLCSQAFGAGMLAQGSGALVHIASISGRNPQGQSGSYSVGKAGVLMLSQQLALEWGPRGVRSNTVSPGLVRTPMTEAYYNVGDVAARRDAAIPIGRVARPDDIAQVVMFLASQRAGYVNGADVTTDGGFELTLMSSVPRPGYDSK
ncbi:MAG: SDR family oxidoreductase [Actinomycetes bacterium]